jgi:N utilization substance protein B
MRRRQARQLALKALYQMATVGASVEAALAFASEGMRVDEEGVEFARSIASGASSRARELDEMIRPTLKGWLLERLPPVDRAILHMALFEMLNTSTARSVIINEAVLLAKEYSTQDSGRFINGVLGTIARQMA